jgi:nucleic acid/nucleotide deaminase of polymorphic system toxin
MDTWQPGYGDVGIHGLLSSLDTFCGNNINLCGGRLTGTIWTTYLAAGGIGGLGPASQRLLGRLITALLAPKAVAYAATNDDMLGRLPPYAGGKTSGIFDNGGNWTKVTSGYDGPASRIPTGTPGFNLITRAHAEGQAAAIMRDQAIEEATLYVNNAPCLGQQGCDSMLPRMLPEGSELRVVAQDSPAPTLACRTTLLRTRPLISLRSHSLDASGNDPVGTEQCRSSGLR